MSALAEVLRQDDWGVSGSDAASPAPHSRPTQRAGLGTAECARKDYFQPGHSSAHITPDIDLVIYSVAVGPENVELRRAGELGIPTLTYAQMLGRLMAGKQGLAVAGTHGKSTTTAMAAGVLVAAGLDPTVVCGAIPLGAASGGRHGRGDLVLVEACEYRGNFLHLRPRQAAILGIEPDHFDCYDSLDELERAFAQFTALTPKDGLLVVRHDCPVSRRVAAAAGCRIETFGIQGTVPIFGHRRGASARKWDCPPWLTEPEADWSARNLTARAGRYRLEIHHRGRLLGRVALRAPGRHNVLNALAAAALSRAAGAAPRAILAGLSGFDGLRRRLEVLGSAGGITVVDDYAHHPTEVAATLDALRRMFPRRRLWCVFQPHQASRTARLLDPLAASLQNADRVAVAEIFRAREGPPRGGEVTAATLAARVRARGTTTLDVHSVEEISRAVAPHLHAGDVLVTMGAGDIGRMAHGILERFREDRAAG
jgi:UDP-N-acetylmuramate--alanine ligase